MYPYFIILLVVTGWIYLVSKTLERRSTWIPLALLTILPTIRDYTIGTDSATYTSSFRINLNPDAYIFNPNVETGYQLLEFLTLTVSNNYAVYFFVCAVIVVFLNINSIKKLSDNYTLSMYCFISFGFYTFFFSGVRQGIAMAICMCAHKYILDNKKISASILIIIGTFFHVSAFIMFLALIFNMVKLRLEVKAIGCFIASIVGSSVLIKYMADSNDRYSSYTDTVSNAGGYMTLMMFSIIGIIFYFAGSKIRVSNTKYRYFEEFYICGMALLVPIAFLGTDPSGPQRVLFYFTWSLIILFPTILHKYKSKFLYSVFIIISLIYFYITTVRFYGLYPFTVNPIFLII